MKLKNLIKEVELYDPFSTPKLTEEQKQEFFNTVKKYNEYGQKLGYDGRNMVEVAKKLGQIANIAEYVTLQEAGDWFDQVTIKRNMKELKGHATEFNKLAAECQQMVERMGALWESAGHLIGRYFEIDDPKEDTGIVGHPETITKNNLAQIK